MTLSLVYRSPFLYSCIMRLLYGRHHKARLSAVGSLVPDGVTVLDVCCGAGELYTRTLKDRVTYVGLDINPAFVRSAGKQGIDARLADIAACAFPRSDYVIMVGSLYQFIPRHAELVTRMLAAASRKVIISEPVRNLSTSASRFLRWFARRAADPGTGDKPLRFDEESLPEFFRQAFPSCTERTFLIPGGRDMVVVLNAKEWSDRMRGCRTLSRYS